MPAADEVYFPGGLLVGAVRRLVSSTGMQRGDSGASSRLAKYDYPLLEFTVSLNPDDASAVEDFFFTQNGPERSFLVSPPLERDRVAENEVIGIGRGAYHTYQLQITKSTYDKSNVLIQSVTKPILHPIEETIVVYANDVELVGSPAPWVLLDLGRISIFAPSSSAITADFHYDTAMHFAEDQQETRMEAKDIEFVRDVTIIEAIGE